MTLHLAQKTSHMHNQILVPSLTRHTIKNVKETKKKYFSDYLKYACINVSYSYFINKLTRAIVSVTPVSSKFAPQKEMILFTGKIIYTTCIYSKLNRRGNDRHFHIVSTSNTCAVFLGKVLWKILKFMGLNSKGTE